MTYQPAARFVRQSADCFAISGDLDRHQVPALWQQRELLWQKDGLLSQQTEINSAPPQLTLTLRDTGQADTAGLALLVLLQAEARERNIDLLLRDLPLQLHALAETCHLDQVLTVETCVG